MRNSGKLKTNKSLTFWVQKKISLQSKFSSTYYMADTESKTNKQKNPAKITIKSLSLKRLKNWNCKRGQLSLATLGVSPQAAR